MASQIITQDQVKDLFEYRDGKLYGKIYVGARKLGNAAGSLNSKGYLNTKINGKLYLNHRIIFLMFNGYLPQYIDHIDNNRLNNRVENLRPATLSQNSCNTKIAKNNTSGVKGVFWQKKKWRVELTVKGKKKRFGCYDSLELAELVATEARNKYHQNYARHF
jgi:hypothetical protein